MADRLIEHGRTTVTESDLKQQKTSERLWIFSH